MMTDLEISSSASLIHCLSIFNPIIMPLAGAGMIKALFSGFKRPIILCQADGSTY